jgi:SAP domain-containing ribonucleoprotein
MSEYAKKKNDELIALCKERGLAHSGKKADLVKRLEEFDSQPAASDAVPTAAAAAAPEDEIDWDEDDAAKTATTAAAANAIAAGGIGQVQNPQAVPNQEAAIDPATTSDLTAQPASAASAPEEQKEEVDFSTGLAARTIDEEIEKRKARARKFGLPEDTEEIKALERAKRFGTTGATEIPGLGLLNGALPEKRERKQRGGDATESDGGIRKKGQERSRGARGKVRTAASGGGEKKAKPASAAAAGEGGQYPGWMTQKDREAADRRKAKYAS